jgi:nucleoside-diphosphate-sugar epimerase
VVLPSGSSDSISLSHPKDIAQALLKLANSQDSLGTYLLKSFDASIADFSRQLSAALGKNIELKSTGVFSGKTQLPTYTTEQIKARHLLRDQKSWKTISLAPAYNLEQTIQEISNWYRKEPWVTKNLA